MGRVSTPSLACIVLLVAITAPAGFVAGLRPASGHQGVARPLTASDVWQRQASTLAALKRLNLTLPTDQHAVVGDHLRGGAANPSKPRMHNVLESVQVRNVKQLHDPSITLEVDRYEIADGIGEVVEVSWSGFEDPAYDDWIALVVPADGDPSQTAPAKWKFAASSQTHITEGRGTLRCVGCMPLPHTGMPWHGMEASIIRVWRYPPDGDMIL